MFSCRSLMIRSLSLTVTWVMIAYPSRLTSSVKFLIFLSNECASIRFWARVLSAGIKPARLSFSFFVFQAYEQIHQTFWFDRWRYSGNLWLGLAFFHVYLRIDSYSWCAGSLQTDFPGPKCSRIASQLPYLLFLLACVNVSSPFPLLPSAFCLALHLRVLFLYWAVRVFPLLKVDSSKI